jgi:hypothetical protein
MTNSVITINNHTSNGDPWEELWIQQQSDNNFDDDIPEFDTMDDRDED